MKVIAAIVAVVTLGACATLRIADGGASHWSNVKVMGPLEAGLLYHQRSGLPLDPHLALTFGDVCGEQDHAAREEAVTAAFPRVEKAAREAWERDSWVLPLRQTLGNYDLQKGGFASGVRTGAVVRFDRADFCRQELSFLVAFRNGDAFSVLRLSEESAKRFVRANPGRTVVHDLEVEVVGWQPGPPGPTLLVDIVRVRTRDALDERVILDSARPEVR
jgi:hypothetical protein